MLSERGKAVFDRLVKEYNENNTQMTTLSYSEQEQNDVRQYMEEPPLPKDYWDNISKKDGEWELSKESSDKINFSDKEYDDITKVYLREHTDTDTVEFFCIEENFLFKDKEASSFRDQERNIIAVYGTIDCTTLRNSLKYRQLENSWKEDYEIEFSAPIDKNMRPSAVVEALVNSNKGYEGYMELSEENVSYTHKYPNFGNVFVTKDELNKMMNSLGLDNAQNIKHKQLNSYKDRVKDKFVRE